MQLNDSIQFQFPKKLPAEYIGCIRAVCEELQKQGLDPRVSWNTSFASHSYATTTWIDSLKALEDHLDSHPVDNLIGITALASPTHHHFSFAISHTQNSVYDSATLNAVRATSSPFDIFNLITSRLPPQESKHRQFFEHLPQELAAFHKAQEEIFSRQRMELLEGHAKLRDAIHEAQKQASQRIEEMRIEFETHRKELEATHLEKLARFQEEREQFEKERASFNDRARMHVRRQHEDSLRKVIDKHRSFELSSTTKKKRLPIHLACLIAMAAGISLYGVGIYHISSAITGWSVSMLVTAALITGSTLVFYLKWLNGWFSTHAEAEAKVHAFEEDFLRANWLVELVFEWQKENPDKPFPQEMLKTLTEGLFRQSPVSSIEHPVSDLLQNIDRLKTFEIDRKTGLKIHRFEKGTSSEET